MTGVTDIDDIGKRINKELPMDKIRNKEEYKQELNALLDRWTTPKDSRPQNLKKLADILYEETAKETIEENIEKYKRLAQNFESRRPKISRIRDESKTAKDTRPINKKNYLRWRKAVSRRDLSGIDTKGARLLRGRLTGLRPKNRIINKTQTKKILRSHSKRRTA